MGNVQQMLQSFSTTGLQISIWALIINLILAAVLSFILGRIYTKFGTSLSNRWMFARNFVLITMTTTLIITVVKSSLALSLGLVGALSIVRFRAAIKEPEELAYLFLAIAIGLGFGADQRLVTLVAFAVIAGMLIAKSIFVTSTSNSNLYLTVSSHNPVKIELLDIVRVIKKHCTAVTLKRFDESDQLLEAAFLVDYENVEKIDSSKRELQELSGDVKISLLDNKLVG